MSQESVSPLPVVRTARRNVISSVTEQMDCEGTRIEEEEERKERSTIGGGQGEVGGGLLWEGEYDEKASAQSFQEALAEWRAGRVSQKTDITGWWCQQCVSGMV